MFGNFKFTSRNLRISSDSSHRFRLYCIYAFGIPAMMTIGLALLDFMPSDAFDKFRPNVGLFRCAIQNNRMEIYLFLVPLAVVNSFSLLFIVLASLNVFKRSTVELASGYTRFSYEKDR